MADIPRWLIDRYRVLVGGVSERASAVAAMQAAAMPQTDYAALRANVVTTLRAADAAVSEIDREFYMRSREIATGHAGRFDRATDRAWSDEEVDRALQAMLREYGDYDPATGMYSIREGEEDRFNSDFTQFVARMVNDASKHYMESYGSMDRMRPRFARVPSGSETCAYCYAIAGLGFQFKSAESAMRHSHANCDCVVTASWDGSGVEGYDPEHYANLFRDARSWLNSAEAPDELRRRVNALSRTEAGYARGWNGVLAAMRSKYDLH